MYMSSAEKWGQKCFPNAQADNFTDNESICSLHENALIITVACNTGGKRYSNLLRKLLDIQIR